jgi:hypothetical protein
MQDTGFTNENFSFSNHTTPKINKEQTDKYGNPVYYHDETENLCCDRDEELHVYPNDLEPGQGLIPQGDFELCQGYVPKSELQFAGEEEEIPSYNSGNDSKQVTCDCQQGQGHLQNRLGSSQGQGHAKEIAVQCQGPAELKRTCCIHSPSHRHLCREQQSQETLIM